MSPQLLCLFGYIGGRENFRYQTSLLKGLHAFESPIYIPIKKSYSLKTINDCHIRAKALRYGFNLVGNNTRKRLEGTENGILSFLNHIEQFLEVFLVTANVLNRYQQD